MSNNRKFTVLVDGVWKECKITDIKISDIFMVYEDDGTVVIDDGCCIFIAVDVAKYTDKYNCYEIAYKSLIPEPEPEPEPESESEPESEPECEPCIFRR